MVGKIIVGGKASEERLVLIYHYWLMGKGYDSIAVTEMS